MKKLVTKFSKVCSNGTQLFRNERKEMLNGESFNVYHLKQHMDSLNKSIEVFDGKAVGGRGTSMHVNLPCPDTVPPTTLKTQASERFTPVKKNQFGFRNSASGIKMGSTDSCLKGLG